MRAKVQQISHHIATTCGLPLSSSARGEGRAGEDGQKGGPSQL